MTEEKKAELISKACKMAGLDGDIEWIEAKKDARTWAERIIERFRAKGGRLPTKNSYMYCDTLDMSFTFDQEGTPVFSYAGYATAKSADIVNGKLIEAFQRATAVLLVMKQLADMEEGLERRREAWGTPGAYVEGG